MGSSSSSRWSLEQQAAQRDATALAARKHIHGHVGFGALQRIHSLGKLAVQVPAVGGVDFILKLAHLLHERVEVGVGVAHLGTYLVEAVDFGQNMANAIWMFSRTVLSSSSGGSCCRIPTV